MTLPLGPNEGEGNQSVWKLKEGRRAPPASPALTATQRRHWGTKLWHAWMQLRVPALPGADEESLRVTKVPRTQSEQHLERVLRKSERVPGAKS